MVDRGKHTEYESKLRDTIAANLRQLLADRNMTQMELSRRSGIPTSTMSDYLNSKSLAVPGNVEKLARALDVEKHLIDPSFADREGLTPKVPRIGVQRIFDTVARAEELPDEDLEVLAEGIEALVKHHLGKHKDRS